MRILIMEPNQAACAAMRDTLVKECYAVDVCSGRDAGLRWLLQNVHDLAILSPFSDASDLIQQVRKQHITTPALIAADIDSDVGVEDVPEACTLLTESLTGKELAAKVRAIAWEHPHCITWEDIGLNMAKRELRHGEHAVQLTRRECALMELLLRNVDTVLPRDALFAQVWGTGSGVTEKNLDNYIRHIRKRLREMGNPLELVTIRAAGFCLRQVG